MKERPILFSGPMVRAILDGKKTQTRRVVKPQPKHCADLPMGKDLTIASACPFGSVGNKLWVKETFRLFDAANECACYDECQCARFNGKPVYRAGCDTESRWKPSIHMPRWASRITLEITGVRVERLQDISEEDARAEGIADGGCLTCGESENDCKCSNKRPDARDGFIHLWQYINGPGSWEKNPWVWVGEFRRVKP